MDSSEYRLELARYRLQDSTERLLVAKELFDAGNYKDAVNRAYYSIFAAVRALLAVDGVDYSKHAGVISYFQREYIKTGKVDKKYSKMLVNSFQIRNNSDYADFFVVSKNDASEQIENAEAVLHMVTELLGLM